MVKWVLSDQLRSTLEAQQAVTVLISKPCRQQNFRGILSILSVQLVKVHHHVSAETKYRYLLYSQDILLYWKLHY